jgi:hypothetical protein
MGQGGRGDACSGTTGTSSESATVLACWSFPHPRGARPHQAPAPLPVRPHDVPMLSTSGKYVHPLSQGGWAPTAARAVSATANVKRMAARGGRGFVIMRCKNFGARAFLVRCLFSFSNKIQTMVGTGSHRSLAPQVPNRALLCPVARFYQELDGAGGVQAPGAHLPPQEVARGASVAVGEEPEPPGPPPGPAPVPVQPAPESASPGGAAASPGPRHDVGVGVAASLGAEAAPGLGGDVAAAAGVTGQDPEQAALALFADVCRRFFFSQDDTARQTLDAFSACESAEGGPE